MWTRVYECTPDRMCMHVHTCTVHVFVCVSTRTCVCMCEHAPKGLPSEESLEGTLVGPASLRILASCWDQEQQQPAPAPCASCPRMATTVLALASACSLSSP